MPWGLLLPLLVSFGALPIATAQAQTPFDWTGFYIGGHAGLLHGDVAVNDNGDRADGSIQGGLFGGIAGLYLPVSPVASPVWSLEGDVGFGDIRGSGQAAPPPTVDFAYDFDWNAHLRLRAGVPWGNALFFLAGGLAFAQLHVTEVPSFTIGGLYFGGTLGGGVDVKLSPTVVGRLELLADKFQTKTYEDYTVDFSSWTARAAVLFRLP